jgi:hypothetical protein
VIYYVYALIRPDTNEIFYIGKGHGTRMYAHRYDFRGNTHRSNIIKKLKELGMEPVFKKLVENLSEDQAFEKEREYIAQYGRWPNGPLTNKTDGGEGPKGRKLSPEHKAKLIEFHTGRKRPPETGARISAALKGIKRTPEQIERHAASLRGRKASLDARANMSAASKGKKKRSPLIGLTCAKNNKLRGLIFRARQVEARL